MDIVYSKHAVKSINRMDSVTKQRIRQAIEGIPKGDIKPLHGYSDGRQRLRVGKYRIVFSYMADGNLYIRDIDSRGDIYK